MRCPDCGTEMKPLAWSVFCPNDCDKRPKAEAKDKFTNTQFTPVYPAISISGSLAGGWFMPACSGTLVTSTGAGVGSVFYITGSCGGAIAAPVLGGTVTTIRPPTFDEWQDMIDNLNSTDLHVLSCGLCSSTNIAGFGYGPSGTTTHCWDCGHVW